MSVIDSFASPFATAACPSEALFTETDATDDFVSGDRLSSLDGLVCEPSQPSPPPDQAFELFGRQAALNQWSAGESFRNNAWDAWGNLVADHTLPTWQRDVLYLLEWPMAMGLGAVKLVNGAATMARAPILVWDGLTDPVHLFQQSYDGLKQFISEPAVHQFEDMTQWASGGGVMTKLLRIPKATGLNPTRAAFTEPPRRRWSPEPGDTRFDTSSSPPVLKVAEHGQKPFEEAVLQALSGRGGIVQNSGPSGVGKGYTTNRLKDALIVSGLDDVVVLEQDWFLAPAERRAQLIQDNLSKISNAETTRLPNEWKGFWNHQGVHDVLLQIRDVFDSGNPQHIEIPQAWHRTPNEAGLNYYPEILNVTPRTVVIFDAKYPVNQLPGGQPLSDFSVRLTDAPTNIRNKYRNRTEESYPDPEVQAKKLLAYDQVIAPSYERFLNLQTSRYQSRLVANPETPPPVDLILDVNLTPH